MELYTAATSDIVASTNELESLTRDWQSVKADNALKLSELDDLRDQLAEISENKTELSGRSRALRAKIHNVDEDIRNKSDRVKSEIRKYFRQLGIRVEQEELNEKENHIEIRITLKDESNASFCLAYDLVSEDFHCEFVLLAVENIV